MFQYCVEGREALQIPALLGTRTSERGGYVITMQSGIEQKYLWDPYIETLGVAGRLVTVGRLDLLPVFVTTQGKWGLLLPEGTSNDALQNALKELKKLALKMVKDLPDTVLEAEQTFLLLCREPRGFTYRIGIDPKNSWDNTPTKVEACVAQGTLQLFRLNGDVILVGVRIGATNQEQAYATWKATGQKLGIISK